MADPRFFAPAASGPQEVFALPADEGEHLRRVLRLGIGDRLHVFDGAGHEFAAEVASVSRDEVRVRRLEPVGCRPETRIRLVLAQAVLKAANMDAVVRDAVMLGAAAIQPLLSKRTEIGREALRRGRRRERWQKIAVSSAKQCGRAIVPEVGDPCTLEQMLTAADGLRLMLVEPRAADTGSEGISDLLHRGDASRPFTTLVLAVGPEGGWTDEELDQARTAAWNLVTLGARTLRADAAPIVGLSVVLYALGEL